MHFFKTSGPSGSPEEPLHDPASSSGPPQIHPTDVEKQEIEQEIVPDKVSSFKGLGWLDRLLALWILLAIVIGILLGNFVPSVGPALQKGEFVHVAIPIGE